MLQFIKDDLHITAEVVKVFGLGSNEVRTDGVVCAVLVRHGVCDGDSLCIMLRSLLI